MLSTHRLVLVAGACLILAALACNAPAPTRAPAPTVSQRSPQATRSPAKATRPPVAEPTQPGQPSAAPGSISGKLCYPGDGIPPMTIYAVDQASGKSFKKQTRKPDEMSYRLDGVTPGDYVVYAWLNDGKLGGTYSEAVPCGLDASCTDHSLIQVTVEEGQDVMDIDVCDWYGPPPPAPPK
jgi:hypothetical protein